MRRYLWGIFAVIVRLLTRNLTKICYVDWLRVKPIYGGIQVPVIARSLQYKGVRGAIKISKLPPTSIPGNTPELRVVWVGCVIRGRLMSPNIFIATIQECREALPADKAEKYLEFLEKQCGYPIGWLVFENCFSVFKKYSD